MRIVWDEPKRLANLAKHGMDFADLDEAFFEASVVVPAKLDRLIAIGWTAERVATVIFAALGSQGISIISMRPASRRERSLLNG